jgi:hypothetical protein
MRRTILLLGAAASAAAFSASPMSLRGSAPARAVSRSGATAVKMDDTASLIIATLPGLAALGLSLQQGSQGLSFLSHSLVLLLFFSLSLSCSFSLACYLALALALSICHSHFAGMKAVRALACSVALAGALFVFLPNTYNNFPPFTQSAFLAAFPLPLYFSLPATHGIVH